ncbi:dynein heavy chain 7, axonemal-like [Nilaparvata lugens]|uniref:dynein heavy chain 7, axonemal-like n=1 Tax=Nilaparvata lugens TaxID=108931 RepID=UPI00193CF9C1|nr:dynein heavy chain 7, axonemal-like [Nilaparvata lugens]
MTVIHFVLTIGGLETQLLQTVMAKERPDLEEKKRAVNVKRTDDKIAQREMEEAILNILQTTGGNIIENEGAIQSLDEAKKSLVKLVASQKLSKSTDESIMKSYYLLYSDVSKYAAMLYNCLAQLVHIDPLYQFSLSWFSKIYVTSIEAVQRAENLDDRLRDLMSHLTHSLYEGVCCCLFGKDCLIFSFILCTSILIWKNQLDRNEVMFLMKPISWKNSNGHEFDVTNPLSDWLPDEIWNSMRVLDNVEAFKDFKEHFLENSTLWRQYYDDENPFEIKLPDPWEKLSHFQKLIILRIFRADKLVPAIKVFVETHLGEHYVVSQQFDLEKSYQESSNITPLLFIQCAGVDPMTNLIQFAEKMQYKNKLQILSLGQGQGELASKTVEKAKLEGSWVCLQNCHLGLDWLSQLEHICENLKCDIHCNFRLWLTSEPTNKLPISVLQRAIKMTFEPPTGLKQNMMSIFCSEPVTDDNFFYGCPGKDRQFTRLLFGMCFFHAVILERKNFGPIGWNIPYSFNESDYKISVQQLQMYLNDSKSVPYEAILYLTGECSYGGQVSDDWDQRTLNTLLTKYINPNMIEPEKYRMLAQSDYIIPIKYEFSSYIGIVQGLPNNPPNDVFGLHSNASISQNLHSTKYLLNAVLSVQPEFIAIKQETEKIDEMHISSIIYDILSKLPGTFDICSVTNKQNLCNKNVMNIVLIQEMRRFNTLLETIRSSIEDLRSAIEGLNVFTPHLHTLTNYILNNHFPRTWMDISYPSRKNLSSYICDLVKRVEVLKEWERNGIPNEYWLSGFYFPQCFLTAVLQNHARKNSFSVADLTFDFEVMQTDSLQICNQGVYVHGLFIEGARWDRAIRRLTEQFPKVLFDTLPLTWFKPILKDELAIRERYRCPIYKTTERRGTMSTAGHSTNYIRSLLLDTDQPSSHWIKRGCALLCQKDM